MSNYTKTTNFGAKDTLPSGDSQKIIRGTEFDTEFNNVATAIATKLEVDGSNNLAISGTFSSTKLIPTGGTATGNGMYLPAANAVAISTNGTERLRIDSSGVASFASNPILNGGTANGLVYLDGSKVATSGSAVTFDGTNLATTGTASATKLIPTGGTATGNGMYLPAANTLALSTNGTERVRVDSSGNLGVGTTVGAASGTGLIIYSPTSTRLQLRNSTTGDTAGDGCGLLAFGSDLYVENRENGATLFFNNGSERARIDSSGNVGVGTTSPDARLTLNGSSNSRINMRAADVRYGTMYADSGLLAVSSITSIPLVFGTNDTERARIDASGNLGIGTTSPGVKLQVVGTISSQFAADGSNASGVRLIPATTGEQAVRFITADGTPRAAITGADVGFGPGVMRFYVNNPSAVLTEHMRLDASGTLGLGVTPSAWSGGFKATQYPGGSVASYASGTNLQIEVGNAYYQSSLGTYAYYNTGTAPTLYRQISGEHRWLTAPSGTAGNAITFTQAMTLDASGNLGVGSTAPVGYSGYSGVTIQNTNGGFINLRNAANTNQMEIAVEVGNTGYVKTVTSIPLIFGTNNTERARIDSSGNLGLGVTPSAWSVSVTAFDISNGAVASSNNTTQIGHNAYYDGAFKYKANGFAAEYRLNNASGSHLWLVAPNNTSGAGAALSFTQAMTLDASGNLGIGTSSPSVKLDIRGLANFYSGASGTLNYINVGRTGTEARIGVAAATNDFLTGTVAGDSVFYSISTGNSWYGTATSGAAIFTTNNTERMRLKSTGQLRFVPLASDPSGAEAGDVYYNSTSNKLKVYNGTAWADLH